MGETKRREAIAIERGEFGNRKPTKEGSRVTGYISHVLNAYSMFRITNLKLLQYTPGTKLLLQQYVQYVSAGGIMIFDGNAEE